MMQNMNMMNNYMLIQNLMNMKYGLTNIESQFNFLLANIQNIGINPEINIQINNISIQFINFGIQMLNIGTKPNNNISNNFVIKQQIDNIINDLKKISMSIPVDNIDQEMNLISFPKENDQINSIFKYNVVFEMDNGVKSIICVDQNITVDELIKKFLTRIGRNDLFDRDREEFRFIYNALEINTREEKLKKLHQIFNDSQIQRIRCLIRHDIIAKK